MELVCSICKVPKDSTAFDKDRSNKRTGHRSSCKACNKHIREHYTPRQRALQRAANTRNNQRPERKIAQKRYNKAGYERHKEERCRKQRERYWKKREEIMALRSTPAYHEQERRRGAQRRKANPEYFLQKNRRRRALKKNGAFIEHVKQSVIFARDKGICQICHTKVQKKDATIDHIIPITKGGEESYKNCVLAHRRCNSRKGNRTVPQQMRLFG